MTDVPLTVRIGRLERGARRDRVLALGMLALALATAQSPATAARSAPAVRDAAGHTATLSAAGLVMTSAGGTRRMALGLHGPAYPSADLFDSTGSIRLSMALLAGSPTLRHYDAGGKPRAELSLAADTGDGEFVIRDARGVTRLAAFRGNLGLPELALFGTDGNARAYLAASNEGSYLVMKDRSGAERLVAGHYTSGNFGLDVRDASGSSAWSKP